MSKYSSLPGYDQNQQTIYGDEEAHSLPEDDRDWKAVPEDENVEIISCEAVKNIKRFKDGDLDQIGEITGKQLTESVETARKMVSRLTDNQSSDAPQFDKVVEAAKGDGASYRVFSNSQSQITQLEQRVARLEEIVNRVPSDPLQPGGTLSDVAQSLAQKSALLEPDQLSQADARLATLLQRFNEIPESLQKLPDMSKWECLLPAIPTIVERLGALAPIHDIAARVAATIQSLEQTQKTIESQLERTEATQNELQNAMAQNLQVATENAKKLSERVEKLQ